MHFPLQEILLSVINSLMNQNKAPKKKVKKAIEKGCSCYVLLTCSDPDEKGEMQVEMNYEGDETLAAFLVANAHEVFESKARISAIDDC